jgi:RNase P/RNase MRP subunit p30
MLRNYLAVDLRGYANPYYAHVASTVRGAGDLYAVEVCDGPYAKRKAVLKAEHPDFVIARGGDLSHNRKLLEDPDIAVMSRPYPLDDTLAKIARDNNVLLELCFADVRAASGYARSRMLQSLMRTVSVARKRSVPLVLTSGATDEYSLVTPRELAAFGTVLGLDPCEAKAAVTTVPRTFFLGMVR